MPRGLRREQTQARVVQADLAHGIDIEVGDEQRLIEHRRRGDALAAGVEDDGAAVEDERVLPAHHVAVADDDGVVGGAGREHALSLVHLAGVEGRAVEVDDHLRAGQRLRLHGARGVPNVLADGDAHGHPGDAEDRRFGAGAEVAALVEDAVVGQVLLVIDTGAAAVVEDGGGVAGVRGEVDEADDGGDVQAAGGLLDAVERGQVLRHEGAAQDEVLGWVAGDGQLRQHDEVAGGRFGVADGGANAVGVAIEVADGGVDLGEGDAKAAHGGGFWARAGRRRRGAGRAGRPGSDFVSF